MSSIPGLDFNNHEKGKKWLMQDTLKAWTENGLPFMIQIKGQVWNSQVSKYNKRHLKVAGEHSIQNIGNIASIAVCNLLRIITPHLRPFSLMAYQTWII